MSYWIKDNSKWPVLQTSARAAWTGIKIYSSHLQLLICHVLAELLRHTLEVLEGDLASLIVIEELERLRIM